LHVSATGERVAPEEVLRHGVVRFLPVKQLAFAVVDVNGDAVGRPALVVELQALDVEGEIGHVARKYPRGGALGPEEAVGGARVQDFQVVLPAGRGQAKDRETNKRRQHGGVSSCRVKTIRGTPGVVALLSIKTL